MTFSFIDLFGEPNPDQSSIDTRFSLSGSVVPTIIREDGTSTGLRIVGICKSIQNELGEEVGSVRGFGNQLYDSEGLATPYFISGSIVPRVYYNPAVLFNSGE